MMVKIFRPALMMALWLIFCGQPIYEYNLFAQVVESSPAPVDVSSSDGAMGSVTLQRTAAYPNKGLQQISSVMWKSNKLFTMQYSVSNTLFFNGPIYGSAQYKFNTNFNYSEPVLAGGILYFECYIGDGYLFAVDANTGRELWQFKVDRKALSIPAVAGGIVYVGANDDNFYALNASTGKEQWKFSAKDRGYAESSPVVAGGMVYFGSRDGRFYALDAQTGQAKWAFNTKSYFLTPAAIAGNAVYFGSQKGLVYALDIKTGQEKWRFKAGSGILTPVAGNNNVYLRTMDGVLYALDSKTGEQRWRSSIGGKLVIESPQSSVMVGTPLALYNEILYFGGLDKLYAVNAQTGQLKWEFKTKSPSRAPIVADGLVYLGTRGGLYAVEAHSGQQKWVIEAKSKIKDKTVENIPSSPAIADGVIYFVSDDGYLYAVK